MSEHEDGVRELGRELPWDRPDDVRRDAVRASLLAAATTSHRRRRVGWRVLGGGFVAGALAAAAVAVVIVRGDDGGGAAQRAQIEASTAADFERHVTRVAGGVDEVVRVHDGRISLAVAPLPAHDRVRVATGDAEVEGEGRYEVAVVGDAIREVNVRQGRATVRARGQHAVFLASGEVWTAPVSIGRVELEGAQQPSPSPSPQPSPSPSPSLIPTPKPTPMTPRAPVRASSITTALAPAETPAIAEPTRQVGVPTEVERHFQAGWALLKAGKAAEAARELGAAADGGGDPALAADARYFEAVALTRAGRKTEAERALVAFLDHAPHALRRGRAAIMLARLIAERGDAAAARTWFESARADPDPDVAASARAGIAALTSGQR